MNNQKMFGTIKWFKETKGYGYIIGSDEESYYFELSDCINQKEQFKTGDKVLFIPMFTELEYAKKVEKVKEGDKYHE